MPRSRSPTPTPAPCSRSPTPAPCSRSPPPTDLDAVDDSGHMTENEDSVGVTFENSFEGSDSSIEHDGFIYANPFHETSEESENDGAGDVDVPRAQSKDQVEDQMNSTCNTSCYSYDSVTCAECGVKSENYSGQWVQSTDCDQVYLCEKCHSEGLAREEADEVDGDGDVTRHNSASSSTVPLSDQDLGEVATPPVSPVKPKKQPRGRRPTNDILKKTPILTRSRSSRMGLRPKGGL